MGFVNQSLSLKANTLAFVTKFDTILQNIQNILRKCLKTKRSECTRLRLQDPIQSTTPRSVTTKQMSLLSVYEAFWCKSHMVIFYSLLFDIVLIVDDVYIDSYLFKYSKGKATNNNKVSLVN